MNEIEKTNSILEKIWTENYKKDMRAKEFKKSRHLILGSGLGGFGFGGVDIGWGI
jgi:hypothetical protein